MNLRDVRMVQRCEHLCLALEAGEPLGIRRYRCRQHFEGDLAPEVRIRRAINLAHPTFANLGLDLVRAQARARSKGHECCGGLYERSGTVERPRVSLPATYVSPITIESGPTSGSTCVSENPAAFIHPAQSAPV